MSSCGLGVETISMFLEMKEKLHDNVYIVSNSFQWDDRGNAIKVNEPIIHNMNKDELAIQNSDVFNQVKERKNVLLLGDSLGDIQMVEGFNYDNIIKIGFLNTDVENRLEQYKKHYDVVILNDSSMEFVNDLVREIVIE